MSTTLSYYDPRSGDTYVIELDDLSDFHACLRYGVGWGKDPIQYEALADIPLPHRDSIEQLIYQRQHV